MWYIPFIDLQIMTVLLPPFQLGCLLFLLAWLLWLGLPDHIDKSGESGHPYLVPELKGNAVHFYPLSMMWAVGLSYMAFMMLKYVPSILTLLRVFNINQWWILLNAFSEFIEIIMWFLSLIFYVVYHLYWFVNIVPTLHS